MTVYRFDRLAPARTQEFDDRGCVLAVRGSNLQGDQSGHGDEDSADTPEPAAKPYGKKHQNRIQLQTSADQKRLHDLAFDGGESEVAANDAKYAAGLIE